MTKSDSREQAKGKPSEHFGFGGPSGELKLLAAGPRIATRGDLRRWGAVGFLAGLALGYGLAAFQVYVQWLVS